MTQNGPIRVAVVDDQPFFRRGLQLALEETGDHVVALVATDGESFIQAMANEKVDLVIIDLNMPRMNGWDTIAWIKDHRPGTRTLAVTFDPHPWTVQKALSAGADAVLDKSLPSEQLIAALCDPELKGFRSNGIHGTYKA